MRFSGGVMDRSRLIFVLSIGTMAFAVEVTRIVDFEVVGNLKME